MTSTGKKDKFSRKRKVRDEPSLLSSLESDSALATKQPSIVEKASIEDVRIDRNEEEHKKKRKRKKKRKKSMKREPGVEAVKSSDLSVLPTVPSESKEQEADGIVADEKTLSLETVFPFPTDADDHCETPVESYKDIQSLLSMLGESKNLSIYDPYFCNGAVIKNLLQLGFRNVYNQKEDCYQVWSSKEGPPDFSVLVTNPPYSEDNIEKLMTFVTGEMFGSRPWFLLMPDWVHKKDYYQKLTRNIRPFYVVPKKRYVYLPPKDFRVARKSDVHKKSSPFVSMWYVWGGTTKRNEELIRRFYQSGSEGCRLARSKSALRDLRRKKL